MSHDGGSTGHSAGHTGDQAAHFGDFSTADILGSDVENISWSTLFQGLKVNTGIRFFVVFTAFASWLYVIYWIRHHEPFSNQVIGVSAPRSRTTDADRTILAGIKRVFPFQTPAIASGSFYTPVPGNTAPPPNNNGLGLYNKSFGEAIQEQVQATMHAAPGQAISAPLIGCPEPEFDQRFGSPAHHY